MLMNIKDLHLLSEQAFLGRLPSTRLRAMFREPGLPCGFPLPEFSFAEA
jgi:hypothetical protein